MIKFFNALMLSITCSIAFISAAHEPWAIVRVTETLRNVTKSPHRNVDAPTRLRTKDKKEVKPWPLNLSNDKQTSLEAVQDTIFNFMGITVDLNGCHNIETIVYNLDQHNEEDFDALATKLNVSLNFIPPLSEHHKQLKKDIIKPLRAVIERQLREEGIVFAPQDPSKRKIKDDRGHPLNYPWNAIPDDQVVLERAKEILLSITDLSNNEIHSTQSLDFILWAINNSYGSKKWPAIRKWPVIRAYINEHALD